MQELAAERRRPRDAVTRLRLTPVMFELGARPHPPRTLYRAYLAQSDVFVGIYWRAVRLGGARRAGLRPRGRVPALRAPAEADLRQGAGDGREPRLADLIARIQADDRVAYKPFADRRRAARRCSRDDLAVLLTERFLLDEAGGPAGAGHPLPVGTSLPHPVSSLLGREAEIEELAGVLRAGTRLVTVVGPGGIGKTRVALARGRAMGDRRPGRRRVRPAGERRGSSGGAARRSPPRSASGLDRGVPALDALAGAFGDRAFLLVLDNVEQVLGSAPDIAALLSRCPGVAVLATSRAALRLRGERLAPLGPLALPVDDAATSLERSPAAQLFVERARDVHPGFSLDDPADAAAVAELCRRLDGLPLALEIAAARSRVLGPQALLERICSALDIGAGAADLPARQRTIRATLAWSEQLLTQDQRDLLGRLAMFAAPWTLADAEAVAGAEGRQAAGDVLDDVGGLVEHSLVSPAAGAPSEPRFWLFESVRAYAAEQLSDDARAAAETAYVSRMAQRIVPLARHIRSPDHARWRAEFRMTWPDLRRAWEIAVRQGDAAAAAQLELSVGALWLSGRSSEACSLVKATVDLASLATPREQTQVVLTAAIWAFSAGEFEWTTELLDRVGSDLPAPEDPEDAGGAELLRVHARRCRRPAPLREHPAGGGDAPARVVVPEREVAGGVRAQRDRLGDDGPWCRRRRHPGVLRGSALSREQGNVAAEMLSLVYLAAMRLTCRLPDESVSLLLEATELMEAEPYYEGNAYCLEVAAAFAVTSGNLTGATEALGLAQTLREVSGARVWALIAQMSETVRAAAAAGLAPAEFEAATRRGRAMDPRGAGRMARTLVGAA